MPDYGPQEDAHTLFLEKTFMLSAFVYTIGYGASSLLTQKGVNNFSWTRRATCNVSQLCIIFVEAA